MKISYLFKNLNDEQREAVIASNKTNILILAGAGSGKTLVLTHRIAWLLMVDKISPFSIMAVTFTNKAATEMRHRINMLLGSTQSSMWIGTFHSLAYRLLRVHHLDANLPQDFQILDSDDQYRLLCKIIKTLNLDENKWSPRQAMWYINTKKNEGLRPQYIKNCGNSTEVIWIQIYRTYQEVCDRIGLVDFAELFLRTYELWLNKPHLLQHYRNRFTNILVDEFQDTNSIQYVWIHILANKTSRIMIVGDDDQSIYGWRGAKVENFQRFLQDFPDAKIIRLEQNYRSTNNILKSANTLITNNNNRLGKNLWTKKTDGEPISLYCGFNELDEACYVVSCIKQWYKKGGALKQCAVLYRNNFQSRVLEETFLRSLIPYHIYGSQRFFERQEIKDVLSYLRLVANRNDDLSFERIVNIPTRGIGKRTLDTIHQVAQEKKLTLWESCEYLLRKKVLSTRVAKAIKEFLELINKLEKETMGMSLSDQTDHVIQYSGLWEMYKQEKDGKAQVRIKNLEELVTATYQFSYKEEEQDFTSLQAFLFYVTSGFDDGQVTVSYQEDAVQLMTLHSAKGLEFPLVFIVGMEEGIFPSKTSIEDSELLAEERRLAYVGLTRAMKKLILTCAKNRRLYGKEVYHRPSRFIAELPIECIKKVNLYARVSFMVCRQ